MNVLYVLDSSKAKSWKMVLVDSVRLRKILSLSITEIETETSYEEFMLFTARKVDKQNGEITVRVNPDYFSLIKTLQTNIQNFRCRLETASVNNILSISTNFCVSLLTQDFGS